MEPPLTPTTKSLVSIGTNFMLSTVSPFSRRNTSHIFWQRPQLELITDPTHNLGPPGAFQQRSFRFRLWRLFQVTSLNNGSKSFLQQMGERKTVSKLSINYAMIPKSEGCFFFGCSPFFCWGGWKGGREWILGVSPHPLIQRRHLSETRTCGTWGLLWKRTSKVPKALHHVLGFMDTASLRDFWWIIPRYQTDMDVSPRASPNKAMS